MILLYLCTNIDCLLKEDVVEFIELDVSIVEKLILSLFSLPVQ